MLLFFAASVGVKRTLMPNDMRLSNMHNFNHTVKLFFNTIKKITTLLAIVAFTLLALSSTGCNRASKQQLEHERENLIIQRENPAVFPPKTYTIFATAADDVDALNKATNIAVRFCDESKKYADTLSCKINHQGMNDGEKRITLRASEIFDQPKPVTTSARDYRVTLKFICIDPPKRSN